MRSSNAICVNPKAIRIQKGGANRSTARSPAARSRACVKRPSSSQIPNTSRSRCATFRPPSPSRRYSSARAMRSPDASKRSRERTTSRSSKTSHLHGPCSSSARRVIPSRASSISPSRRSSRHWRARGREDDGTDRDGLRGRRSRDRRDPHHPLPPTVLDVLLGIDICGSAIVLLMSLRIEEALEFSAFPSALLLATLFRLALDVSATRLILTQGHEAGAVGSIIPAFGAFVVRGNIVVGLIVFAIVVTIQFIVIASGSQRVAEVCARFTLDAMPGKQMAIDADLHAGLLDAASARRKRARIQREADFYAAMDGAGKFVKGDAIAALVIVVLNLLGGVAVGMLYHAMSPADALGTF